MLLEIGNNWNDGQPRQGATHASEVTRRPVRSDCADHRRPCGYRYALQQRAFSLIELIIVLGVISMLCAMLLPVLSNARRQAQSVACLSNLQRLAQMVHMYCSAHKNSFPRPAQMDEPCPEDWIWYQPDRSTPFYGSLQPYGLTPSVLICPADPLANGFGGRRAYPYSYSINANLARLRSHGPTLKIVSRAARPACEKVLFICESNVTVQDGSWAFQSTNGNAANLLSGRHDSGTSTVFREGRWYENVWGNVVFVDGHAGRLRRLDSFLPKHSGRP